MVSKPKAYLNTLAEEGTREELIHWLVKLDGEVDALKEELDKREPVTVICDCEGEYGM